MYNSKRNPTTITGNSTKLNQKRVRPLPCHTRVKVILFARPLLTQLRKSCAEANMVYSQAERVFILEHYFASNSFVAVREAFSNAYPDKEVPNKTIQIWRQ
jgi:hypothetical protein